MVTTWSAVPTLDPMFDDIMGSPFGTATNSRAFDTAIDVRANENEVLFVCDVPGVRQDDLEVTLADRRLTVKGTRRFESNESEQVVLGRAYGSFKRVFVLPDYLDDANLQAQLADGVLTIRIPKQPQARPRKVPIANGAASKQLEG